jgi:hydrogenase maturation factor
MRSVQIWFVALALAPCAAQADSLRCGDRLILTDAPAGEVVATRASRTTHERSVTLRQDSQPTAIQRTQISLICRVPLLELEIVAWIAS